MHYLLTILVIIVKYYINIAIKKAENGTCIQGYIMAAAFQRK